MNDGASWVSEVWVGEGKEKQRGSSGRSVKPPLSAQCLTMEARGCFPRQPGLEQKVWCVIKLANKVSPLAFGENVTLSCYLEGFAFQFCFEELLLGL